MNGCTGELIRLSDNNIPTLTTDPALFLNSSGDVLVCCPTEKNPGIYVLSDEAPRAEDSWTVSDMLTTAESRLEDTIDVIQNRVQLYLDERDGG